MAEIHAHEIELLVRHAGGHGSIAVVSIGIFTFRVGDRLIVEGFGILFAKKPVGRLGAVFGGLVWLFACGEAELVRAPTPVENIGVCFALSPVDE